MNIKNFYWILNCKSLIDIIDNTNKDWRICMVYKFKEYKESELLVNHLDMGGVNSKGETLGVTNRYFTRSEKPWIGVMGEFHYSRYNKSEWKKELAKMKAGGITIISSYIIWIYHEEEEGTCSFDGDNDVREFVSECKNLGLDVIVRIGPWVHGEVRNGGFPDWLLKKPFKLRENNEGYLLLVRRWYEQIYKQLEGFFYKDGGNIIAVQIENELVGNASHLRTLKKIAIDCGFDVPFYTVTGWSGTGGTEIPVDEVIPVFGGYCEAPWEQHTEKLSPSPHYFFNRMRNDSAIGADLMEMKDESGYRLPYERYPFATCELGGGIQVTHHRRPIIKPMDIYAVALVKLGCGNNLMGYYMYHGGTNKTGKLSTFNETRASGYINDYSVLSYDFQAPLSEYGETRAHFGYLNMLHMFANDFGDRLAPMEAVDSEYAVKVNDNSSLRYGMRTNGESGFVFVNHYQRLTKLEDVKNVVVNTGVVEFPSIDVCGDIAFFMPFNMELGGNMLEYATAQPLCCKDETYFFAAIDGITPEFKFSDAKFSITPGDLKVKEHKNIKLVVLNLNQAAYLRKLSGEIYLGDSCDVYEYEGEIQAVQNGNFSYYKWDGNCFYKTEKCVEFNQAEVSFEDTTEPFIPKFEEELNLEGERKRRWKKVFVSGSDGFIEICEKYDAAQIYADGEIVADNFWYGKPWRIPAKMLYEKECYLVMSEVKNDFYNENN